MNDLRKAAEMALDALTVSHPMANTYNSLDKHSEAMSALRTALAQPANQSDCGHKEYRLFCQMCMATKQKPEQEPVAWYYADSDVEIHSVALSEDLDDDQKANCIPLYTAPPSKPINFLLNGTRYKVTHQRYYGCSIVGLPENLNGQWVALVEATDSKHLNCIAHQESTKPEQEPVAWLVSDAQGRYATIRDPAQYGEEVYEPLYAAPVSKPWVSLTDEEADILIMLHAPPIHPDFNDDDDFIELVNAIEAKLKEKNA